MRTCLGAVDQRNELGETITEEVSTAKLITPRLIRELNMLMHYILVMKTRNRCRCANAIEEFAKRQFVGEWDPRFIGTMRNVLSCRRKDDVPTQITETVIDDIVTDVNVLRMEDERVKACTIGESTGIASCVQVRKENLEITRIQQCIDSNLVPVQIGVQPKSKGKSKQGKDARKKSFGKAKDDDQRKCYYSRKAGRAKSRSRTRWKDLADTKWKSVTAKSRPSSIAADAPLADDYVTMFHETTMRSDAGSTAPTGSECVRHTSAIPTCETCLMTDTCAGGRTVQEDLIKPHRGIQLW